MKISFVLKLLLLTPMSIKSSSAFSGYLDLLPDFFFLAPLAFFTNICKTSSISSISFSSSSCSSSESSKLSSVVFLHYTNIKTMLRHSQLKSHLHRGRGQQRGGGGLGDKKSNQVSTLKRPGYSKADLQLRISQ